jgi:hypothetical protein
MDTIDSAIESLLKQTNRITIGSVFGVSFVITYFFDLLNHLVISQGKNELSRSIGLMHASFGEKKVTEKICNCFST